MVGDAHGEVRSFDSLQVEATAQYNEYDSGQPTGGTLTDTDIGGWSVWSGGTMIQPSSLSDNPTSATCSTDQETCTLMRHRDNLETYSGATQATILLCEIDQAGSGDPTCPDMNGDGLPDPVGTQVAGAGETVQRFVFARETQEIEVTNDAYIVPEVLGCTNPSATNYDPDANVDDGSCEFPPVPGCTDSTASNYNPDATSDDGSCEFIFPGCTNSAATNYDPDATVDNGTCIIPPPSYDASQIIVTTCSLDQDGNTGLATTNHGITSELVGTYTANTGTLSRFVNVTFSIDVVIPEGFANPGTTETFEFIESCLQLGIPITPEFVADSAQVLELTAIPPNQNVADGESITLSGGTGTVYHITAPNTTTGTAVDEINGGGPFNAITSRTHTFTLPGTTDTYQFFVRAGTGGGGGFNPFAP